MTKNARPYQPCEAFIGCTFVLLLAACCSGAQTPARALLVLEKAGNTLDIIDPVSLRVVAKLPAGQDPHEVVASADGKLAYVSNFGGRQSTLHTISVIDLVAQKVLPPIDLGALHGAHGLSFAGAKLYFTAQINRTIGRYDPATGTVDWVMGTGQDRTHMIWVSSDLGKIVTSNVGSATMCIIQLVPIANGGSGPPLAETAKNSPSPVQHTWDVTIVSVGKGSEGFDVSPDGKEIWVANAADHTVSIIEFASKKVIETLPITSTRANRLKFTPDGKLVLITDLGAGESGDGSSAPDLLVLDAATRKEVKQLKLGGGAAGILMDPIKSRAFVAVTRDNKVVVIDLKTLSVTTQISPLGQVDGMAWR